jgi:trans-aconitate 2-methyltransferase
LSRPRDWDAATYDRVADPMTRWGEDVPARLPLTGRERVLDAGCGSGRVTEQLVERLPEGVVVALDGSPAMLDEARRRLGRFGPRVAYVVADLRQPLPRSGPLVEPFDAILSTATFHWIADHDALFSELAGILRPGGRLVAQFGGRDNIASIQAILVNLGDGWPGPWAFAGPEETRARLEAAGFDEVEAWLQPEPTPLEPGEPTLAYLRTVILGDHLARLGQAEREPFVAAVAARLPRPEIDYVRLNVSARRAG